MQTFLIGALIILSIAMVVLVMMQPSKNNGIGVLSGGAKESYYSKNKVKTKEVMLRRATIVVAGLLALVVLFLH